MQDIYETYFDTRICYGYDWHRNPNKPLITYTIDYQDAVSIPFKISSIFQGDTRTTSY